jgi:hypothetical protein
MGSRIRLRTALALVTSSLATAARAEVVPPSKQPGRERERFVQPPTTQLQPGGPVITLPDTFAPKGADADFSVAKAVEGPRNDERFFFVLSAHN